MIRDGPFQVFDRRDQPSFQPARPKAFLRYAFEYPNFPSFSKRWIVAGTLESGPNLGMRKYRPFPRDLTLIGRRCGFYIRCVRNPVAKSTACNGLGLNLD